MILCFLAFLVNTCSSLSWPVKDFGAPFSYDIMFVSISRESLFFSTVERI